MRTEDGMTVRELVAYLSTQPQDLPVAYRLFSEHCLLETSDIAVETLCKARDDGWVPSARPDKATQEYLVLPGN
jgi:hypothetical protein